MLQEGQTPRINATRSSYPAEVKEPHTVPSRTRKGRPRKPPCDVCGPNAGTTHRTPSLPNRAHKAPRWKDPTHFPPAPIFTPSKHDTDTQTIPAKFSSWFLAHLCFVAPLPETLSQEHTLNAFSPFTHTGPNRLLVSSGEPIQTLAADHVLRNYLLHHSAPQTPHGVRPPSQPIHLEFTRPKRVANLKAMMRFFEENGCLC
jgi:hypothetical protein